MNRPNDPRRPGAALASKGGGWKKTLVLMGALAVLAIVTINVSRRSSRPVDVPPRPTAVKLAGMRARELQDTTSKLGVAGGVTAGMKAIAKRERDEPVNSIPVSNGVDPSALTPPVASTEPGDVIDVTRSAAAGGGFTVRARSSKPYTLPDDHGQALDDALSAARQAVADRLAVLDAPVKFTPSVELMREYLVPDSEHRVEPTAAEKKAWEASGVGEHRAWVEVDVQVTDSQVRDLRARERLLAAGWFAGAAAFAVLVGFILLRLDIWTKGYLSVTLAVVAAVVIGGLVAAAFVWK